MVNSSQAQFVFEFLRRATWPSTVRGMFGHQEMAGHKSNLKQRIDIDLGTLELVDGQVATKASAK